MTKTKVSFLFGEMTNIITLVNLTPECHFVFKQQII